jgi:predicted glycosyltransferase
MTSLNSMNFGKIIKNYKNISISNNLNFIDDLMMSEVLITEASSSSLESVALGIPVVLLMPGGTIGYNPFPEDIPGYMYRTARGYHWLIKALIHYSDPLNINDKIIKLISDSIMDNYFEPMNEQKIIDILNHH